MIIKRSSFIELLKIKKCMSNNKNARDVRAEECKIG